MAPSTSTNASSRTQSHLRVIHNGIFKKARREQSAPSSPCASHIDAWAEMDGDSVERPADIYQLSGDQWDLEEAGCADDCTAAEDTSPADDTYYDTNFEVEGVWSEADHFQRAASERGSLLFQLFLEDAAPSSDLDESAGVWAAEQDFNF